MVFPPIYNTREMADHESFTSASSPSRRLPRPMPTLFIARSRGRRVNFELPEMVQATFYAMLLNKAVELGMVHGFMAKGLKSALVGLRWSSFKVWTSCVNHQLRKAQLRWPAIEVEVCGPLDGQEESFGSNGPPAPSSNEEKEKENGLGLFPNFVNTEQAVEYVRERFRWSLRDPTDPGPRPLPSDYHGRWPCLTSRW
ncbi:hypothetical protein Cgig2_025100 [Carnegiea gigantea]|uniref:Uncharacterized protein n=1 Tax=Carnegiea gigantea TaxID=171969 RepID=A0A9Q1KJP6_9CARY|nr:hypothetical protein Cgig2_025100 [Carnegiea gigantea]